MRRMEETHFSGKLVLLMGPSGVGKSVILKHLKKLHPHLLFPRSATTRHRRKGESADLYRFVSDAEFDALDVGRKLLESAVVHGGARYGTLIDEIIPPIEEGRIVVREVDVQGFDNIRTHQFFRGPEAPYRLQSIFIIPEDRAQLIARITKRAPISAEELERRIASMDQELTYAKLCDAQVVNREGRIEETIREVEKVILA
jgi:guanylate kinase